MEHCIVELWSHPGWYNPILRIDLRPMRHRLLSLLAAVILVFVTSTTQAQELSPDIGGPESDDEIELLPETDASKPKEKAEIESLDLLWDVNDSLFLIPGYDLYCHWNTDALFNNTGTHPFMQDSLRLYLSRNEGDHNLPCKGPITSAYGPRNGRMHRGVDIDLLTGDPVVNVFPGMVRISRYSKSYGHVVVVRHYNGLETVYAHLSKRGVETGQLLQAGDTLGLGGNTGRSYGSHLHFEVRFLDQPIDPALVFDLSDGSLKAKTFNVTADLFGRSMRPTSVLPSNKIHTVRRGDTLSGISRKYGTSVTTLCKLNRMSKTQTLKLGQKIRCN